MHSNRLDMDEWNSDGLQQIPPLNLRPGTNERNSNSRSETERNVGFYRAQALDMLTSFIIVNGLLWRDR